MSAKERKKGFSLSRNQIIVLLLALVVILIAYGVVTNYNPDAETIYSPDDLFENPDDFLGKNVTVKGYYYDANQPEGRGFITSVQRLEGSSSTEFPRHITIDHSNVNTTGLLNTGIKYEFTGVYTEEDAELGTSYVFIVSIIKE